MEERDHGVCVSIECCCRRRSAHADEASAGTEKQGFYAVAGGVQLVDSGREYLRAGKAETAGEIFQYIKENASSGHSRYFVALANLGYSFIDQQRYEDAVAELHGAITMTGLDQARPWQTVALAFAYYKIGHMERYREWLEKSRALPSFEWSRRELARRYPEIAAELLADQALP